MSITAKNQKASKKRRVLKQRRVCKQRSKRRATIGRAARRSKATLSRHSRVKYIGGGDGIRYSTHLPCFAFNSWVKKPENMINTVDSTTSQIWFPRFEAIQKDVETKLYRQVEFCSKHTQPENINTLDALRIIYIFLTCIRFILNTFDRKKNAKYYTHFTESLYHRDEHFSKELIDINDYIEVFWQSDGIYYPAKVVGYNNNEYTVEYAIFKRGEYYYCFTKDFSEGSEFYQIERVKMDLDFYNKIISINRDSNYQTFFLSHKENQLKQRVPPGHRMIKSYKKKYPGYKTTTTGGWPKDSELHNEIMDYYYMNVLKEELSLHSCQNWKNLIVSAFDAVKGQGLINRSALSDCKLEEFDIRPESWPFETSPIFKLLYKCIGQSVIPSEIGSQILLCGTLSKRNKFHSWQDRYFMLDNNGLCYAKDAMDTNIKRLHVQVCVADSNSPDQFDIVCSNKTYRLKASNENEREQWVNEINDFYSAFHHRKGSKL